ncbi:unnamed protein product [Rotaria socialis]|uniref:Peptidase C14 caspase domain-containing protein n=1 Tax=Rotaria socialis TaxID=392032 RepID=A0A817REX2_9BILA|nr:unnamed protein product [Rotaria socialis]CAF3268755.1 unnamed protein product [Rotaria socialis]CAF4252025.1 unnamed protein product [Rotaria socialis]CAF4435966.1 unnamed protein product [Rotaria socialis]
MILDACRTDKDNDAWEMKTANEDECRIPAFGKALTANSRTQTKLQFVLIFSYDPGTVSFVGDSAMGTNSLFISALLNHLSKPNLRLEDMMLQITQEVLGKSTMIQRPWLHTCLTEPFYFNKEPQATAPNNSRYSDKEFVYEGCACGRCDLFRDWHWYPDSMRKHYTNRSNASCTGSEYVDPYVDEDGAPGDSYRHRAYIEDDDYDNLDLDLDCDCIDIDGVYHTGLTVDEYGDLCECHSNK